MNVTEWAAIVVVFVLGAGIAFQLLLAAGAPLGQAAWGGRHQGVLPPNLRWASLASAGVLALAAWVALARAGLVVPGADPLAIRVAAWAFAGFMVLNTVGNLASGSEAERRVMTPLTVLLAVEFFVVATSPLVDAG